MGTALCITIAAATAAVAALVWRHQRHLKRRAGLMQEAVRNRDFTFRLPTRGLLPGERAMQEALNQMGAVVQRQMNQHEVESWERLTRVLTHEIMNATAPIASISQTLLGHPDVKGSQLEEPIRAIHTTSHHLNTFIESYRKLTQLQVPAPEEVDLRATVADITLLHPAMQWTVSLTEGTTLHTDPAMLRQVLTNLARNAAEARAGRMAVEAHSEQADAALTLYVSNDGDPIPAEVRPSVFIPFFTTKRTGSGVGLSLSRRMLSQQGGDLQLLDCPRPGFHTTFALTFPIPRP